MKLDNDEASWNGGTVNIPNTPLDVGTWFQLPSAPSIRIRGDDLHIRFVNIPWWIQIMFAIAGLTELGVAAMAFARGWSLVVSLLTLCSGSALVLAVVSMQCLATTYQFDRRRHAYRKASVVNSRVWSKKQIIAIQTLRGKDTMASALGSDVEKPWPTNQLVLVFGALPVGREAIFSFSDPFSIIDAGKTLAEFLGLPWIQQIDLPEHGISPSYRFPPTAEGISHSTGSI